MLIYIAVIVTAVFALDVYRAVTCFAEDRKHLRKMQTERTEKAVARAEAERAEEKEARDKIDEGIENIMTFSVGGKTGFEGDE